MEKRLTSVRSTAKRDAAAAEPPRAAADEIEAVKSAILTKLTLAAAKDPTTASDRDWFIAAALTVRDRIVHRWAETKRRNRSENRKTIYYLSLEFLIGRLFSDVLGNLGLTDLFKAALGDLGVDLARLRAQEPDAALGNGGLGRLAACFMDSMASVAMLSRKQAASRPRPPLPSAASGSAANMRSISTPRSPSAASNEVVSCKLCSTSRSMRPIRNSSDR